MLFELIASIFKDGWILTVAGVCIGLYIDNKIREKVSDKESVRRDLLEKELREKNQRVLETILATEQEVLDAIKSISLSLLSLAEQVKGISANNHDQQASLNSIMQEMKMVTSNQISSSTGLQRIVEKLIDSIKD